MAVEMYEAHVCLLTKGEMPGSQASSFTYHRTYVLVKRSGTIITRMGNAKHLELPYSLKKEECPNAS